MPKKKENQFKNFTPYQPKKGEEYMSDAQLEHFNQILNAWRDELRGEVDRTVTHMKDEAANFPDPAPTESGKLAQHRRC